MVGDDQIPLNDSSLRANDKTLLTISATYYGILANSNLTSKIGFLIISEDTIFIHH
jgi:hypothetical protein